MFNNPPASPQIPKPVGTGVVIVSSAVILSLLYGLLIKGVSSYALGLFVAAPVLIGFLPVAMLRLVGPRTLQQCNLVALGTASLLFAEILIVGWEGLICIAMALPLELPLLFLGAILANTLFHARALRPQGPGAAAIVAVLGLSVSEAGDLRPAPSFVAADSVLIRATPERVWREIVDLKTLPSPSGLLLKTGLACPQSVRIPRPGEGGVRLCTLSTGQIFERIDVWEPGRRLRWHALSTPPPMKELNPFRSVDAPHLHGFFDAFQGEFALEPAGPGATRLTRRTWYRHNLRPAAYWRFWCDLAASQAHDLVLQEIRRLAEAGQER